MKYKHLFFDLDGTLWDLYQNTQDAFRLLLPSFQLHLDEGTFSVFIKRYFHHNEIVWKLYRENKIEKNVLRTIRFRRAFDEMGWQISDAQVEQFADAFLETCPRQPHLIGGTHDILSHFHGHIPMHIITNGFKEIQGIKMDAGKIGHYFQHVINSEDVGIRKPFPQIFQYAMDITGAEPHTSLMIGDDWEADILGARDFGMDTAWLRNGNGRHNYKPTFVVNDMRDLLAQLVGQS